MKPPGGQNYVRADIDRALAGQPAGAPVFDVIESEAVQSALDEFAIADAAANDLRNDHRRFGSVALRASTCAAVLGAGGLLPMVSLLPAGLIGSLQFVALLTSYWAQRQISKRDLVAQWMTSRATAERLRGEVFQKIIDGTPPPSGAGQADDLGRFHVVEQAYIRNQLGWYQKRAAEHRAAAKSWSAMHVIGYGFTFLAALVGATVVLNAVKGWGVPLPAFADAYLAWAMSLDATKVQLALGTIASSLLAHTSARTLMDQDDRNAALYARTAKSLGDVLKVYGLEPDPSGGRAAHELPLLFKDARHVIEIEHLAWETSKPPAPRTARRGGPSR